MQESMHTSSMSHTDYSAESHKPSCGSMNSALSLGVDGDKSDKGIKLSLAFPYTFSMK